MKGKNVIAALAERYHGLYLPVGEGMSRTPEYKRYVLQGRPEKGCGLWGFTCSREDAVDPFPTPAGEVETIYLDKREDFELFLQKLAYRCEPERIPPEVGAMMISGVINWEKIRRRKREYLDGQGTDWPGEFRRFTKDPGNYKDRVLVLSGGPYSNYPAGKAGYSPEEWKRISVEIRRYHECTHYVCRTRWSGWRSPVLDEVLADAVGLLGALGKYDRPLALAFLGVLADGSYTGGRLSTYAAREELDEAALLACRASARIEEICRENASVRKEPFLLTEIVMGEWL